MRNKIKVILTLAVLGVVAVGLTACNTLNDQTPHTTIKGTIAGQPFSIENPKDTILNGLLVTADPSGAASISISNLSTVMKPENIQATGDAESKIVTATGQVVHQTINDAQALLGTAGAAALLPK